MMNLKDKLVYLSSKMEHLKFNNFVSNLGHKVNHNYGWMNTWSYAIFSSEWGLCENRYIPKDKEVVTFEEFKQMAISSQNPLNYMKL